MTTSTAPLTIEAVRWAGGAFDGHLELLEQRELPATERWVEIHTCQEAADAIRDMVVRGAPAIGLAAAYGVVLAAREIAGTSPVQMDALERAFQTLADSRPTAVNLQWALDRMRALISNAESDVGTTRLLEEADRVRAEDIETNQRIGAYGSALLPDGARVYTHCNTGALATAGVGTALGVIRVAHRDGKLEHVIAGETRPYLQGARLTMWELMKEGISSELATDGMAGHLMKEGLVDAVIVGADRVAANGDAANKIGTYGLAVLAKHHGIPFYVAAPVSTLDPATATGASIVIEERAPEEVTSLAGISIAPEGAAALHPAFDVTPAELISGLITEEGVASNSAEKTLGDWIREWTTDLS